LGYPARSQLNAPLRFNDSEDSPMHGTSGVKPVKISVILPMLLSLGVCLLLAGPSLAQNPAPSGSKVFVADVNIEGVRNPALVQRALTLIHTKKGREYSEKDARDDIARLAASNLCRPYNVRTEPTTDGRVNVIFVVREFRSVVREVVFKHAKHVDQKELEGMTRIRNGMPLDPTLNQLACHEIADHLRKQGYYFANVTLEEGFHESHERVVFNITEGPKVRVRHVDFTGNEFVGAERLRTQIDTSRAFLGNFGGSFNPAMVDNDVFKIEEYYRNNGFHKVHVARELQFSDDFMFVDVVFHIQEGTRFRVESWDVTGSKHFSKDELKSIETVKTGVFYTESVISADVRNTQDYIGWRGYQAEVKKIITDIPGSPDGVHVSYLVEEKEPAKVGQMIIVGNTVTQDRVIRRILQGIQPGQVLRYPELRIAERDLARLAIFETNPELGIRPTVQALDSPGPFKDILVKVQETRTGSLMLGAGINSDNGVVGSIVLNERNFDLFRLPTSWDDFFDGRAFRGAGQELRIEAVPGTEIQRYSISIREPFLFDQPYSLLTSAYYRDRIFDEYTENRWGGRINLGHQFTKEWSGSVGVRLENVGVFDIAAGAPVDYTSQYGTHQIYAPGITVAWDTRDSFMRPTEGGKLEFSYEQVFGSNTYPILNLEGSRYFTLWQRPDGSGKHVLAFRSQVSWAGDQDPVYERFFGGGYMSIRGFEFRGVGPNVNGFMVGGQFQLMNSMEYQIPIRANDNLYFVTFLDSGTVESKIGIHDYRVSAGFGLRITVPMLGPVPIALDFGFPIVKAATDRTQLFSFWIGMYR
jgi:outer membrane protein insertion porin family